MATGLIASLGNSATATYTPTTNAKVYISMSGGSAPTVSINGLGQTWATAFPASEAPIYVGAGQTLTVTTNSTAVAIISSIEES